MHCSAYRQPSDNWEYSFISVSYTHLDVYKRQGERTEEHVLKIRSQFIPYYDEHNADLSRPYPGIYELLKTLQQQGIRIAVASNKYQAATRKLIAHYFPEINFVEVLGQREGIPAKPDPSILSLIHI